MKIKIKQNCTGVGYKDCMEGEERNIRKEIAEKLIKFGYAEEVKAVTKRKTKSGD
ncbi:hypothetical protein [Wukongibacter sp. M2B1]|uniref:hypothetical protein n=1 Tax=Wukongibacter sp. M2B1 TaxID=3088895 RepID=UPI003D79068A